MGEDPTIAIVRALKVRVPVLDRFLDANGVDKTYGIAPFYDIDPDERSRLLRSKVGRGDTHIRIFVPEKIMKPILHMWLGLGRWCMLRRKFS